MSAFTARYRSLCERCEDWIEAGEVVRWWRPDPDNPRADSVIHSDCRAAVDSLAVTSAPCGTCFTVPATNGTCGCDE